MTAGLDQLIQSIADVLWAHVKAHDLAAKCVALGLDGGEDREAFGSKRIYVRKRIVGWSREQLVELANKVLETFPSDPLQRMVEQFTPDASGRISEITRQRLFRDIFALGPLEGNLDIGDFLGRLWHGASMPLSGDGFHCTSTQFAFTSMSNKKLVEFLELVVHPLVRVDADQERYVDFVNKHLKQDGLALVASESVSGFPVYRVAQNVAGVSGLAKNLIFASIGPKPEIVFTDAVNNDIQIVKNADSCLIYDQPFPKNGLMWKHLLSWWVSKTGLACDDINAERNLFKRLRDSLQSPPERHLFESYFACFRSQLGEKLPALIPQVYLHYDPYTARQLKGDKRVPRQRMDFLLLLSSFERIVIEVDGSQHYSDDEGHVAPYKYAEMVKADRELRLAGYEVYRFGGLELGKGQVQAAVSAFFSQLFAKHNIRGQKAKQDNDDGSQGSS